MVMQPSTNFDFKFVKARSRRYSGRLGELAMSKLSCTRESAVLTPCPPGPDDRENFTTNSACGITTAPRMVRSSAMR